VGGAAPRAAHRRTAVLTLAGAAGVAGTAALHVLLVATGGGWSVGAVLATTFGHAAIVRVAAALALAALQAATRDVPAARGPRAMAAVLALAIALTTSATGHAAAQAGARATGLVLDALHQGGATLWVGALLHLLVAVRGAPGAWIAPALRRFSRLALGAAGLLALAAVPLAARYVDGPSGLLGTSYGIVVVAKALLLIALLALAAANTVAVRAASPDVRRVRVLVEVEIGLALAALVAAASLTSLPPAIDVRADRATPAETFARFAPRWPTLATPTFAELAAAGTPGDPDVPRTDADRAWSEYNHNTAGLLLAAAALVAGLEGSRRARWARHWPVLLVALVALLIVRADPEAWPLGPAGPWESLLDPEVLQHRALLLLAAAVAGFEWLVRTGRVQHPSAALVFPLLCAAGAPLLLVHGHAVGESRAAFFMEASHAAVAVLGLAAGWARWLELRLPGARPGLWRALWSAALALAGLVLVYYRE
jgi:putative copper resistance protein D